MDTMDTMDADVLRNEELSALAEIPGGKEAFARFGAMVSEGRPTPEIEAFLSRFPDNSKSHVLPLRRLIGGSAWSALFFLRDDLCKMKGYMDYLPKNIYTQAFNRDKERKALATGDWARLVRHPRRDDAWAPLAGVVRSVAQLRIDSMFLQEVPLAEILRSCAGLRKSERVAVFAHSPWVFRFYVPQFLNSCTSDDLRFLRDAIESMPLEVASACLVMVLSENGGSCAEVQDLFRPALFFRQSLFAESVLNFAQDIRQLRIVASTIGDAIRYFRIANRVPAFDWIMDEAPEDYLSERFIESEQDSKELKRLADLRLGAKSFLRNEASDTMRYGNVQSLADLSRKTGGKKTQLMLQRYALLAVLFFSESSACAVLRGIEAENPGLIGAFHDKIGNGLSWYLSLRGKLQAKRRKAWSSIPGAKTGDSLAGLLYKISLH